MNLEPNDADPPRRPERPEPERTPATTGRARRALETRRLAAERVEESVVTNSELLEDLAARAGRIPPDRDLVKRGVSAARASLTNLESARVIAEQIRAEIELSRQDALDAASDGLGRGPAERFIDGLMG